MYILIIKSVILEDFGIYKCEIVVESISIFSVIIKGKYFLVVFNFMLNFVFWFLEEWMFYGIIWYVC